MSDYARQHDFSVKDALTTGDPDKVIKGSEVDAEFDALVTAVASKTDDNAAAITGGSIDNAAIGGTTPAAIVGTTIEAQGSLELATGAVVTGVADEDNMASDSATLLATQQSIKAYIDAAVAALSSVSAGSALTVDPIAAGGTSTHTAVSHGLGAAPTFITVRLICDDAGGDLGYSQNDEVFLQNWDDASYVLAAGADPTDVWVAIGANPAFFIPNKSTGVAAALTASKWKLVVTPYLVA